MSEAPPPEEVPRTSDASPTARGVAGSRTRRQLLKTGVGLAGVGAAAYGYSRTREQIFPATDGSVLDDVPDRSEFVFTWRGDLFTIDSFRAALDDELGALAVAGAGSTTALLDGIEAGTGIDPRQAGRVAAFGRLPRNGNNYAGLLFESEVDAEQVRARVQQRGALTDTSRYREQTLWRLGVEKLVWTLSLAHLRDTRYGLASRPELEDVVDVRRGDAARVDGPVRDGLEEAGQGVLRGGFVVPPAAFESVDLPVAGLAETIEYGSVTLADGVLTVRLVAPSDSAAADLEQTVTALGQIDREIIVEQIGSSSPVIEVVLAVLADLETAVEGSVVRATVADGYRVPAALVGFLLDRAVV